MVHTSPSSVQHGETNQDFLVGLSRAFAGSIIFALPLFMTMEMWAIGSYVQPARFLIFIVLALAMMILLAFFSGFEQTDGPLDAVLDGITAFAVGVITSGVLLWIFGIFPPNASASEMMSMVALQAVPAGMGAVLARKQLGGGEHNENPNEERAGYFGQLFLMLAGAIFVAFNVAPTEEMLLITVSMSPWQTIMLMGCSILILHAFVYTVGFGGQQEAPAEAGFWGSLAHYTLVGYGIAVGSSAYVLWTFGHFDDASLSLIASMAVVLGFPAAIGAGIARLVI